MSIGFITDVKCFSKRSIIYYKRERISYSFEISDIFLEKMKTFLIYHEILVKIGKDTEEEGE
jgi:hypothetical protein